MKNLTPEPVMKNLTTGVIDEMIDSFGNQIRFDPEEPTQKEINHMFVILTPKHMCHANLLPIVLLKARSIDGQLSSCPSFVWLTPLVPVVFRISIHSCLELKEQKLVTKQFKQQLRALTAPIKLFTSMTFSFQNLSIKKLLKVL